VFSEFGFGCPTCKKQIIEEEPTEIKAVVYFYGKSKLIDSLLYIGFVTSRTENNIPLTTEFMEVRPNPVQDKVTIKTSKDISEIRIFNIQGALITAFKQPCSNVTWDTISLPNGAYIIRTYKNYVTVQSKVVYLQK
jgi:hypothetical protein